jgi:hypothetical protein
VEKLQSAAFGRAFHARHAVPTRGQQLGLVIVFAALMLYVFVRLW